VNKTPVSALQFAKCILLHASCLLTSSSEQLPAARIQKKNFIESAQKKTSLQLI